MAFGSPCNCRDADSTLILYEDGSAPPRAGNVVTLPNPADQLEWRALPGNGVEVTYPSGDLSQGHRPRIAVRTSNASPLPVGFTATGELTVGPAPELPVVINEGTTVRGGIRAIPSGSTGRRFDLSIELSPSSPVPVRLDEQGRLSVGPVTSAQSPLVINTGVAVYRGVQHTAGGPAGHSPTIEIAPSPESTSRVGFDSTGRLRVDPPHPWLWESVAGSGGQFTLRLRNTLTAAALTIGTA